MPVAFETKRAQMRLPTVVAFAAATAVFSIGCAAPARQSTFHAPTGSLSASGTGASTNPNDYVGTGKEGPPREVGLATWYAKGKKTASGEPFDPGGLTAAHRTLPFGTWIEVRRRDSGRTVRVRINDRGPFGDPKRIIDLSKGAAERLDFLLAGVANVEIRIVSGP
jgi:rare lipoprotein A